MSFARYLLRRLAVALLLMFLASSAALLLTLVAPGRAGSDDCFADPQHCQQMIQALGLDRPLATQYFEWVSRALRFDFGESVLYSRPVGDLLGERALNTAVLATAALVTATLLGLPLGVYTGSRMRGPGVTIVRLLSLVLLSMPPLLASLALVLFAARTGWLEFSGMMSEGASQLSWAGWAADIASHLPVPALALALPLAAELERIQSQAISVAIREPFVRAAQARGLSRDAAIVRHGWRVSLIGVLSLYGVIVGTLFSGSFIVEVVTSWPGLGRLMFDALRSRDLYLIAGCAAIGALFLALGTFFSDVLVALANPRVHRGTRA